MPTVEYVPVQRSCTGIFSQIHVDGRYWGLLCYTGSPDMTYLVCYLDDEGSTAMYIVNAKLADTIDKLSRLVCAPF